MFQKDEVYLLQRQEVARWESWVLGGIFW